MGVCLFVCVRVCVCVYLGVLSARGVRVCVRVYIGASKLTGVEETLKDAKETINREKQRSKSSYSRM